MQTLAIHDITAQKLRQGIYAQDLPEYYALQGLIENGLWHDHQDIFDHVVSVYENLERVEQLEFVDEQKRRELTAYLEKKVSSHSRKELLRVATLLHDIAKQYTLVTDSETGKANCPGHELLATGLVPDFSKRFELDTKEEERVERIVRFHGFISDILTQILANGKDEIYWQLFEKTVGDVATELALLMLSDARGSDLQKADSQAFIDREKLLLSYLHKKSI